jgi:hypothetical protein
MAISFFYSMQADSEREENPTSQGFKMLRPHRKLALPSNMAVGWLVLAWLLMKTNITSTHNLLPVDHLTAPPPSRHYGSAGMTSFLHVVSNLRLRGGGKTQKSAKKAAKESSDDDSSSYGSDWESSESKVNADFHNSPAARMMEKMGWAGGGLGRKGQGIKEAISATGSMRRSGIGTDPGESEAPKSKSYRQGDLLFSDSSENDSSDYLVGRGGEARKKKKRWKQKVDEAMGKERVRKVKNKAQPNVLDPENEETVEAFTRAFDKKYKTENEVDAQSAKKQKLTNWQELDRETRDRAGMRGVGEVKHATSAYERRKAKRKKRIFDLREKHRANHVGDNEVLSAAEQQQMRGKRERARAENRDFMDELMPNDDDDAYRDSDSDFEDSADIGVAPGEHFDPTVPYMDVTAQEAHSEDGQDGALQHRVPHVKPIMSHAAIIRAMGTVESTMDGAMLKRAQFGTGRIVQTRGALERRAGVVQVGICVALCSVVCHQHLCRISFRYKGALV